VLSRDEASVKCVKVLYFAAVRDLMGRSDEQLELPETVASVASFVSYLEQQRPRLRGCLGSVRVAVNEAFAEAADPVHDGDVIALIPPVAGG
jgi:sulfur-carrier protein